MEESRGVSVNVRKGRNNEDSLDKRLKEVEENKKKMMLNNYTRNSKSPAHPT